VCHPQNDVKQVPALGSSPLDFYPALRDGTSSGIRMDCLESLTLRHYQEGPWPTMVFLSKVEVQHLHTLALVGHPFKWNDWKKPEEDHTDFFGFLKKNDQGRHICNLRISYHPEIRLFQPGTVASILAKLPRLEIMALKLNGREDDDAFFVHCLEIIDHVALHELTDLWIAGVDVLEHLPSLGEGWQWGTQDPFSEEENEWLRESQYEGRSSCYAGHQGVADCCSQGHF
jgi:hypothetical protein